MKTWHYNPHVILLWLALICLSLPVPATALTGQDIVNTAIAETTGNHGHYRWALAIHLNGAPQQG